MNKVLINGYKSKNAYDRFYPAAENKQAVLLTSIGNSLHINGKSSTRWISIKAFGATAESLAKLPDGTAIVVEGSIESNTAPDGKRYQDVVIRRWEYSPVPYDENRTTRAKAEAGTSQADASAPYEPAPDAYVNGGYETEDGFMNFEEAEELPFS